MNHRSRLQTILQCLVPAALFFLAGFLPADAQTDSVTRVRAVHLVSDAPGVDVYIDDVTPATLPNVKYLDASRSLSLKPGQRNIKIGASGTPKDLAVINQDIPFNHDTAYTVFATGRLSSLDVQPVILKRSLQMLPTPGRTLVRFMNGSAATSNMSVRIVDAIGSETNLQNMEFRTASDYVALSAGDLEVEVSTPEGTKFYSASGITPTGAILTIIAVGDPLSETFKLSVLLDSDSLSRSPMDTLRRVVENPAGRLRFVHASHDAGSVDLFFGEQSEKLATMAYRDASQVSELSGGKYMVKIASQGSGAGSAFLEKEVEVIPSLYRSAFLVGSTGDETADLIVLTADASANPSTGKSSLRVLNASTDIGIVSIEIKFSDNSTRSVVSSGYRSFTPYEQGTPGNATVRVIPDGETDPLFVATGNIPANIIGTLVLTGRVEDKSLRLNLLLDSENGAQTPMTMFDGMVGVEREEKSLAFMNVAPNPVRHLVTLSFGILEPQSLSWAVYGLDGRAFGGKSMGAFEVGNHAVRIELSALPSGTYLVVLRDGEGRSVGTRQIVVL